MRSRSLGRLLALTALASACQPAASQQAFDWRTDWAVEDGFAIQIDTEGYHFPTAIAFVPNPGPGPDDPLYFVTELRGTIKVVTNDRSIHTFAEVSFDLRPKQELPSGLGETGLAGICLDPAHGYVFVTFTYQDQHGVLRNNVGRFESTPGTFSLSPTASTTFPEIFAADRSAISHQIGPCAVDGDRLYVSVGEAGQPFLSQQLSSTLGKLLRLDLDGNPPTDNPFYRDASVTNPANFVWAFGLRNPFSLELVDGRVFVADNGVAIDRFLEIRRGENYLWDGTDWSIGARAAGLIAPSVGPVQMDFATPQGTVFPREYEGRFFLATAGVPETRGVPNRRGAKGILVVNYDLATRQMAGVPTTFARYRGSRYQSVVGLQFGPDALYFVPLFPNQAGSTPVLKIVPDSAQSHPFRVGDSAHPQFLLGEKGCYGCHVLDTRGYGTVGPPLDTPELSDRLLVRLHSSEYVRQVQQLDTVDAEPLRSYRGARREVLAAEGMERVRIWMRYRLQEPRFDDPRAQMPNLSLSDEQATILTSYLLEGAESSGGWLAGIRRRLPKPGYRLVALAFACGLAIPLAGMGAIRLIR